MPLVQGTSSVGSATPVSNALTGSIYERPTFKARVRYYICGDAAGATRAQINHGARTIMETCPISTQNRTPIVPDDFLTEAIVMPYEQIVLRLSNTVAGPNNIFWKVQLDPIR